MRSVPEWIGKTDDSRIPDRVRLRIFLRSGGRCHCCDRPIFTGEAWELDHIVALANGGEHRESNLSPILREHHRTKTKGDAKSLASTRLAQRRHYGIPKKKGKPLPGSKRSGWKRKLDGTWVKREDRS